MQYICHEQIKPSKHVIQRISTAIFFFFLSSDASNKAVAARPVEERCIHQLFFQNNFAFLINAFVEVRRFRCPDKRLVGKSRCENMKRRRERS